MRWSRSRRRRNPWCVMALDRANPLERQNPPGSSTSSNAPGAVSRCGEFGRTQRWAHRAGAGQSHRSGPLLPGEGPPRPAFDWAFLVRSLWSCLNSGDPQAGSGPIRRPYHRFSFPERNIATNSCTGASLRPQPRASPSARNVTCATSDRPKPIYKASVGAGAPVPRPVGPALVPPLRGAFFVPWSCRPKGYPDKVANGAATCRSRAGFSPSRPGVEIGNAFGGSGKLGGAVGSMIVKSASRIARTAQTGYSYLSGRSAVLPTRLLGQSLMLSSRRVTCALRSSHFRSRAKRTAFSRIGLARSRDNSSDSRLQICSRSEDSPCGASSVLLF